MEPHRITAFRWPIALAAILLLPATWEANSPTRLLLNPTSCAGVAVMVLAWRWGGAVVPPVVARP